MKTNPRATLSESQLLNLQTAVAQLADRIKADAACPGCTDFEIWLQAERRMIHGHHGRPGAARRPPRGPRWRRED